MASRSKQTKHIRVRYYFIKDIISTGDIVVKYCTIREMLASNLPRPYRGDSSKNSDPKYKESLQPWWTKKFDGVHRSRLIWHPRRPTLTIIKIERIC